MRLRRWLLLAPVLLLGAAPRPGMVSIPAGEFEMGRTHSMRSDETPRHRVRVADFELDETLVTVEAFRRFVEETHHRTSAEKFGFGMVAWEGLPDWHWEKVAGATWRLPFGPKKKDAPLLRSDDPVSLMSWNDANAYCRHLGKRLPTEAEWEYAMRADHEGTRFPWGDSPERPDGKLGVNFWQGSSHEKDETKDGFLYFSPVKAFPPNEWGVYDVSGNVWQWVSDYYASDTYRLAPKLAVNPGGPAKGTKRVARGGSWWCSKGCCAGYGLYYRGKNRPYAAYNNIGFRCAADVSR